MKEEGTSGNKTKSRQNENRQRNTMIKNKQISLKSLEHRIV